jgi:hypothetical protein
MEENILKPTHLYDPRGRRHREDLEANVNSVVGITSSNN